jgi:hypothetical protein
LSLQIDVIHDGFSLQREHHTTDHVMNLCPCAWKNGPGGCHLRFERRNEWIIISNYQLHVMVKINVVLVYMVNDGYVYGYNKTYSLGMF